MAAQNWRGTSLICVFVFLLGFCILCLVFLKVFTMYRGQFPSQRPCPSVATPRPFPKGVIPTLSATTKSIVVDPFSVFYTDYNDPPFPCFNIDEPSPNPTNRQKNPCRTLRKLLQCSQNT